MTDLRPQEVLSLVKSVVKASKQGKFAHDQVAKFGGCVRSLFFPYFAVLGAFCGLKSAI
jgi:hypothetical protein